MLRLRLLLGASCSFYLRIWDVDFFDDVVIRLGWVVAADAVGSLFTHYEALIPIKGTVLTVVGLEAVAKPEVASTLSVNPTAIPDDDAKLKLE